MPKRGTTNRNARGGSDARRRRRAWLVKTYASDVPGHCRCFRCGRLLTEVTVTVDRIVPGCEGGTYARHNIRPACADCNQRTGSALGNARQTGKVKPCQCGGFFEKNGSGAFVHAERCELDFNQLGREIAAARIRGVPL